MEGIGLEIVSEFNVKDGCVNGQNRHVNAFGVNVSVSVVALTGLVGR
ncbi:hypothetical protein [Marinifilum breve]|nr:hypothetical protein [Marinifilum breve]